MATVGVPAHCDDTRDPTDSCQRRVLSMYAFLKRATKRPLIAGGILSAAIVLMSLSGAAVAQQEPATSSWPVLEVASPNPGALVSTGDFVVIGTAFDPAATTGSGISRVDLF